MLENSIVFLYNQKAILYDGNDVQSADFKESKNHFTTAIIPLKLLNTFSYKIASTTNDDEIAMQTEIKMYTEGGLNADKEYVVDYIKYNIGSEYLIEAFALSKENFDDYFAKYTKKVTAVDILFPRFLVYQTLYDKELDKDSNDLILYISETESFATLYQHGRYIGYRALNSLSKISKRAGIEITKLKEYLQTKGLLQSNYDLDEIHILDSLQSIFSKDMEKLVYTINQKRTFFGIDKLDRVFIDFDGHDISGIEQFFISYGYESLKIDKLEFKANDKYGDISMYADYSYKLKSIDKKDSEQYKYLNFSFLERKKPLSEYLIVKYGFIFAVSIMICLIAYISFEILLSRQESEIHHKQVALKKEKAKALKFEKKLISFKKEYLTFKKKRQNIEDNIFVYENTLTTIPLIQNEKYKRQKFMNDVVCYANLQFTKERQYC